MKVWYFRTKNTNIQSVGYINCTKIDIAVIEKENKKLLEKKITKCKNVKLLIK